MGADGKNGKPGRKTSADVPRKVASELHAGLLANLSHELRTPMDAILGYVELLAETVLTGTQQTYIAAIESSAQGLLDIMNDVLNLARLEAGKLVIHNQPFSVRDCIDSVSQMLAPSAYSKKLDFIRLVDQDVPVNLVGDPLRIRQILVNLVGNAIKFTNTGQVRLRASAHPYDGQRFELILRITDTGIGLSPADIDRLFEPFTRLATPNSDVSGTGLGLVITRALCTAMNGSIAVHSTPADGSTFCVRIPLQPAEELTTTAARSNLLEHRAVVVVATDIELANAIACSLQGDGASTRIVSSLPALRESLDTTRPVYDAALLVVNSDGVQSPQQLATDWQALRGHLPVLCLASTGSGHKLKELAQMFAGDCLPVHSSMRSISQRLATMLQQPFTSTAEPARSELQLAGLRLLVAEDNRFGRVYLQTLLQHHGAKVDACADGNAACELLETGTYDLVLMDMRMPGCDGAAAMQRIQRTWRGTPPIIGLTAAADERERALAAGMTDCLVKPIRPAVLLQYLQQRRPEKPAPETTVVRDFIDAEMRTELQAELPRYASVLHQALAETDLPAALEPAHKINGIGALCGFDELRRIAAAIEGRLQRQQTEGLDELCRELQHEIEQLLASLADL